MNPRYHHRGVLCVNVVKRLIINLFLILLYCIADNGSYFNNTYSRVTALADDLSENVIFWIAFCHWHHVVGGQRLTTTVDLHHLGRLGGLRRRCRWRGRLHGRRWRHDDDLLLRLVVERGSSGGFSCCYL